MVQREEIEMYCKELAPADVERAIEFNKVARDEAVISYQMFLTQSKLPRKIFIEGYNAMYSVAAHFLAAKHNVKIDEVLGGSHKNMRIVLEFYTRDAQHHAELMNMFDLAIEKFLFLSQKYRNEKQFADRVVKDLIAEGYYQGKKVTYYSEVVPGRKDPLKLTIEDAKKFVNEIVEPFLFIMDKLTND